MILKKLNCYLLVMLLAVPMIWSQERAIRPVTSEAISENRQALVIGNSEYQYAGRLRNPVNDARAIGSILKQLGFKVTTITNADQRKIERSIRNFGKQLKQNKGVGLFYFAGHGMQFDGENYLLPTDIDPSTEEDVRYDAVPLGKLLAQMRAADNGMNVVVLDACRNNPFSRSFRTFNPGLAQINAAAGTFISFATAPGQIAADGEGSNGLFTSKLLNHLQTPGLKIEEVFKRTTADVYLASNKRQAPWVQYSVIGDFYFSEDTTAKTKTNRPPQVKSQSQKSRPSAKSCLEIPSNLQYVIPDATAGCYSLEGQEAVNHLLEKNNCFKCEIKGFDLRGVDLRGASLIKAILSNSRFFKADLEKAEMSMANLVGADFTNANLKFAVMQQADLRGSNFTLANLIGAHFHRANLSKAILTKVEFALGSFTENNLKKADLTDSNMRSVNFGMVDLSEADLSGADLRNARFYKVNLTGANLNRTNLIGAKFCKTTMPDGTIRNDDC